MARRHLAQLRIDLRTLFDRDRAAGPEATTGRRVNRRRHVALQDYSLSFLLRIGNGNRRQQRLRVRMKRMRLQVGCVCDLDNAAQVHNRNARRDVLHDGQSVRDE